MQLFCFKIHKPNNDYSFKITYVTTNKFFLIKKNKKFQMQKKFKSESEVGVKKRVKVNCQKN
jgi:hypothetical protein